MCRHYSGRDQNKAFGVWGSVFGDDVLAAAILDRLLHHCDVISITARPTG